MVCVVTPFAPVTPDAYDAISIDWNPNSLRRDRGSAPRSTTRLERHSAVARWPARMEMNDGLIGKAPSAGRTVLKIECSGQHADARACSAARARGPVCLATRATAGPSAGGSRRGRWGAAHPPTAPGPLVGFTACGVHRHPRAQCGCLRRAPCGTAPPLHRRSPLPRRERGGLPLPSLPGRFPLGFGR